MPLSQMIGIPVIALKLSRAITEQWSENVASKALPIPTWLAWAGEVVGVDHRCRWQPSGKFRCEARLSGAAPAVDGDQPRLSAPRCGANLLSDVVKIQASKLARPSGERDFMGGSETAVTESAGLLGCGVAWRGASRDHVQRLAAATGLT